MITGANAEHFTPLEYALVPVSPGLFVGRAHPDSPWTAVVVEGGYLHFGVRAMKKVDGAAAGQ